MIKTVSKIKEEREDFIKKISDEIVQRGLEVLEKAIEDGFFEFCENGKISTSESSMGEVASTILGREKVTLESNHELYFDIIKEANLKIKETVEQAGWEYHRSEECLVPKAM